MSKIKNIFLIQKCIFQGFGRIWFNLWMDNGRRLFSKIHNNAVYSLWNIWIAPEISANLEYLWIIWAMRYKQIHEKNSNFLQIMCDYSRYAFYILHNIGIGKTLTTFYPWRWRIKRYTFQVGIFFTDSVRSCICLFRVYISSYFEITNSSICVRNTLTTYSMKKIFLAKVKK